MSAALKQAKADLADKQRLLVTEQQAAQRAQDQRAELAARVADDDTAVSSLSAALAAGEGGDDLTGQYADGIQRAQASAAALAGFDRNVLPQINRRVAAAEEAVQEAARRVQLAEAQAAGASATKYLEEAYSRSGSMLRDAAAGLASARALVAAANGNLPAGASPLPDPEGAIRDRPARPREEVSRTVEMCWAYVSTGHRLPADTAAQVEIRSSHRGLIRSGGLSQTVSDVALRPFWKITYLPEAPAVSGWRLSDLDLPGLEPEDPAFLKSVRSWRPTPPLDGVGPLPGPAVKYLALTDEEVTRLGSRDASGARTDDEE